MAKRGQVYNKIYTPELWEQVNKENKKLIDDYLVECKAQKKKKGTIDQYFNDLRIIAIYILQELENKSFIELNKKHFRNMTLWMMEKNMSSSRCNRLMSAVRSMLDFAENDDDYDYETNFAKKVKGLQKESVRDICFLTDDQITRLRNELIKLKKYKYALLLDLSYDSAGRRNEVFQINKNTISDRGYTNEVIGKRGKKFNLVYFSRTKESFKLYMEQRGDDDIDSLWVIGEETGNKRPANYNNLYDWCLWMSDLLSELEGKVIPFNNHSFRHSALENMKNGTHYVLKELGKEKFELAELQIYAHHSDISTTQSYMKKDDNNIIANMFGIVIEN